MSEIQAQDQQKASVMGTGWRWASQRTGMQKGNAFRALCPLYHSMRDLKKEVFKVIYLNAQHQIIGTDDLFHGTVDGSFVPPREVIESALRKNAVALILAHNHPSGSTEPSKSDHQLTRDLVYAASLMQISILDHLIIGDNQYYSFAREGLIKDFEVDFLGLKLKHSSSRPGKSVKKSK